MDEITANHKTRSWALKDPIWKNWTKNAQAMRSPEWFFYYRCLDEEGHKTHTPPDHLRRQLQRRHTLENKQNESMTSVSPIKPSNDLEIHTYKDFLLSAILTTRISLN